MTERKAGATAREKYRGLSTALRFGRDDEWGAEKMTRVVGE
jgi:hypothetical protein